jgi:outer membrane protein assembly factor BamB
MIIFTLTAGESFSPGRRGQSSLPKTKSMNRKTAPPGASGIFALIIISASLWTTAFGAETPTTFKVRCGVRFLTPESAELRWESNFVGRASVAYGPTRKLDTIVPSPAAGTSHRVVLEGLVPGQSYFYRIGITVDGKRYFSPFYELHGHMNYSPPVVDQRRETPLGAETVIEALEQPGGFAVVACEHLDAWSQSLAAQSSMTVVAVCEEAEQVDRLRNLWYDEDKYGIRLTAQMYEDVPDKFANVVVCDAANLHRLKKFLSPSGLMVCLGKPEDSSAFNWTSHDDRVWIGRPSTPTELSSWGHQYGSLGNASYAGETLGGVDDTSQLEIRWLGRPGADFGIDRNPRMPAPLAVGGRLFHQGMNRMIALDAFNGAVLWSLEIPDLRRVNIPRDCANWCADQQHVYAATRDCLWVIDAATGEMKHTIRLPEPFDEGFEWGYVAVTEDSIIASAVKAGSAYEDYWSKVAWYDSNSDASTSKVCGSALIVYDKEYGDVQWQREVDAAVQSTITIAEDRMFLIEANDPDLRSLKTGKLTNQQIWKNASAVCLDLKTGLEQWKKSVPAQADDQIVAFGIADDQQFLLETSSDNHFHFVSFDSGSGEENWTQSIKWPSDNHGAHMQHAVLMNDKLYVQPHILDAVDGRVLRSDTLGKRRGCATPIGAGNSIIYRGGSGPLSLWSLERDQKSEFTRLRPSCWLSTIPAQGMLFSPEAGGGCSCGGWMECSIGFAPVAATSEQTE